MLKRIKTLKHSFIVVSIALVFVVGGILAVESIVNNYYGETLVTQTSTEQIQTPVELSIGGVTAVDGICDGSEPTTQMCNLNVFEIEIQSDTFTIADVIDIYDTDAITAATSTPCAFRSPTTASSTLEYGSIQIDVSSTTATQLTIAKASNAFATTTLLGITISIAANAQLVAIASTTTFAPGEWLVFGLQGGISSSTIATSPYPNLSGTCKAVFRRTD